MEPDLCFRGLEFDQKDLRMARSHWITTSVSAVLDRARDGKKIDDPTWIETVYRKLTFHAEESARTSALWDAEHVKKIYR
jgi:hypothetical protein